MKYLKAFESFTDKLGFMTDEIANQFISDLSTKYDLRLGKPFDKEKANCAWFTKEFFNWSKKQSLATKIIYFDHPKEAHIAPWIDGKVLDFTIKQFTKDPNDDYLILEPQEYKKYGYYEYEILEDLPKDLTIMEADPKINEDFTDKESLIEKLSEEQFRDWEKRVKGAPQENLIPVIRLEVDKIERSFGKRFNPELEDLGINSWSYHRRYSLTDKETDFYIRVQECDDEWYIIEVYSDWYFSWFLCDTEKGLSDLARVIISEMNRP